MSTQFTNRQWRLPNNENKDKQSNYSMDFDSSSSDYIDIGTISSLNAQQNFSISLWFNENIPKTYGFIFSSGTGTNNDISINAGNGTLKINVGGTRNVNITSYSSNVWYHVVLTVENTTAKVYLNNSSPTTVTVGSNTSSSSGNNAKIGDLFVSGYHFNGQIDAVSIFDYALTDGTGGTVNQIAALYGSSSTGIGNPMSLSPKPVAMYNLGDQDAFNGASYLTSNSSLKDFVFDFTPNDYIDIGNQNELKNITELSVSLWFNYDSIATSADGLVARDSSSRVDGNWYVALDYNNSIRFLLKTANGQDVLNSSTINANKWYHTLCVWDGQNMKIYLNGSLDNSITLSNATGTLGNASDVVAIGRRFASDGFLNGKASNVQTFNTALSSTDAETLYNNGSPLTSMTGFTSLQGWWKLDASATYDGSNWTIPDDSSNSNDGTSSGMTQANLVQSDLSFTSGYSPYALDFDGANDYINFTGLPDFGGGSLSISFWIKSGIDSSNAYVLMRSGFSFYIFQSGTASNLKYRIQTSSLNSINGGPILDNNWHNCVMTFDSTANEFKVFEDGNQVGSTVTTSGSLASSTSPVYLASFATGAPFKSGSFSNLSMWNTALTSAQVTELYNEAVPSNLNNHSAYSNLVSWWQLGSNSSFNTNWTVLDEKGSNNGTSVNMAEDDIVDGVGSYANGLSSGMGGDEVIGDAPYSSSNSLSVNMDVEDRVTDTPS